MFACSSMYNVCTTSVLRTCVYPHVYYMLHLYMLYAMQTNSVCVCCVIAASATPGVNCMQVCSRTTACVQSIMTVVTHRPQARRPLSAADTAAVASLDAAADIARLKAALPPSALPPAPCLLSLHIGEYAKLVHRSILLSIQSSCAAHA
jgi:hypothetical protein